jgi:hypothetical protein
MEWNGMEWNGMEWNGMEWNGTGCMHTVDGSTAEPFTSSITAWIPEATTAAATKVTRCHQEH